MRVLDARMLVPGDLVSFRGGLLEVCEVKRNCVPCRVMGIDFPTFFPSFSMLEAEGILVCCSETEMIER